MKKDFVIEIVEASRVEEGWKTESPCTFTVEDDGFGPIRADVKRSVIDGFVESGVRGEVVATGDITAMLWESGNFDGESLKDALRKVMVFCVRWEWR